MELHLKTYSQLGFCNIVSPFAAMKGLILVSPQHDVPSLLPLHIAHQIMIYQMLTSSLTTINKRISFFNPDLLSFQIVCLQ